MLSFPVVSSFREWNKKEEEIKEDSNKELNEHLKGLKNNQEEIKNVNSLGNSCNKINEEKIETSKKNNFKNECSTPKKKENQFNSPIVSPRLNHNKTSTIPTTTTTLPTTPKTPLYQSRLIKTSNTNTPIFSPIQKSLDVSTYSDNDNFISFFNTVLEEQQKINLMNMKLNCVNLFANYANLYTTNKLKVKCNEFEEEISLGKKRIEILQSDIFEQKEEILDLNSKVFILDEDLSEHKLKLNDATQKYYTSISELESTMSFHKKILNDLESRALKEDFALDGLISLVSLFFVNTR